MQARWNGWKKYSGLIRDKRVAAKAKGEVHTRVVRPAMLSDLEMVLTKRHNISNLHPWPKFSSRSIFMLTYYSDSNNIKLDALSSQRPSKRFNNVSPIRVLSRRLNSFILTLYDHKLSTDSITSSATVFSPLLKCCYQPLPFPTQVCLCACGQRQCGPL